MALATLVGGVRLSTFAPEFVYAMWRLLCGRAPDALRPLLLSNCDGELFAAALKTAVEPAISSWALAAQRSFFMLRHFPTLQTSTHRPRGGVARVRLAPVLARARVLVVLVLVQVLVLLVLLLGLALVLALILAPAR